MWKVWTKFWRNKEEWRRIFSSARTHARIRDSAQGREQLPISWLSINRCAGFNNPAADCYRCLVHKTRPEYIARHSVDNRSNFNRGRRGGGREAELDSRRVILSKIHVKRDMPEINPRCVIVDFGLARSNT